MRRSNTNFPSQVVSDQEKLSKEYGLEVARAIENEWFNDSGHSRYLLGSDRFHQLRLYARGEQSIQKYKDELSINGDLSYLNLDWKPVPIVPKFVDIVVNGMSQRNYETTINIEVLGYLIGEGENQERPKIVTRENAVEVKIGRERAIMGDIPDTIKDGFYRE